MALLGYNDGTLIVTLPLFSVLVDKPMTASTEVVSGLGKSDHLVLHPVVG